jgi:lysophospholipase L1-like esterase
MAIRYRVCAVALALLVFTGGTAAATSAEPAAEPAAGPAAGPRYYLALGDSLSVGVQPDATGRNTPTDQGYVDDLYQVGRLLLPRLRLVKLGCSGETIESMAAGGGCPYPAGSQLAAAIAFLRAHRGSTALVTIDIGANDLSRCLNRGTGQVDPACVARAFGSVSGTLARTLAELRAAGGPGLRIMGMNYYNPFLASWLQGAAGQALARQSTDLTVRFNDALEAVYGQAGARVADVERAFASTDFDHLVPLDEHGQVPRNVARICRWVWMCAPPPQGPNIHARAEGYWVIAAAFAAELVRELGSGVQGEALGGPVHRVAGAVDGKPGQP